MSELVLQITNGVPFHYEVVERVIVHYRTIVKQDITCAIYLDMDTRPMRQFREYICGKYPHVRWGAHQNPDYFIGVTLYPREYDGISDLDPARYFFISHRFEAAYQPPNVLYLAPFAPAERVFAPIVLPFQDVPRQPTDHPVFVIQGGLNERHRDLSLLWRILESQISEPYTVLLLGSCLTDKALARHPRVVVKEGIPFLAYHWHFRYVHAILPLVSRRSHPQYYSKQLTSSVQYARAYNIQCVLDRELQAIYRLPDAVVYEDENDVVRAFWESVTQFYRRRGQQRSGRAMGRGQPVQVTSSLPPRQCQALPIHSRSPLHHG